MLPDELKVKLREVIAAAESPREKAIDVMFEIQELQGWMSDQAMVEAAELLGMTPLELEELATFYDYIYRSPVGKYVIKVCDSTVCWLEGRRRVVDYIASRLAIPMGGTSADGLFTLLPVCCIGYCDRAPAMVINKRVFGNLTPEKIDRILSQLAKNADFSGSE
ncbi:MAG: NADH-quinone oxidoreductase subunit NuoE [Syntrophobacteraceae bacterium]|nr:NADH-quinone oxidoreductase subunit NuoE [Syntrophobacteraceae bacterium]